MKMVIVVFLMFSAIVLVGCTETKTNILAGGSGGTVINNITDNSTYYQFLTQAVNTTSNSIYTNVSELHTTHSGSGQLNIECLLYTQALNTSTGVRYRVTVGGTNYRMIMCEVYSSTTAQAVYYDLASPVYCNAVSSGGTAVRPTRIFVSANMSSVNDFNLELLSEVSGAYVNLEKGSWCRYATI